MKEAREAWFEGQLDLDPERVVFLDETATATNMERRYGRALQGERCRISVPHGHYKTTTVTAALRASGPFAVELMDGATNGQRFLSYVTHTLVPALTPGDTVVMDNLAAHKVAGVRQAIEAAGAYLRYLPAYSPDFNPSKTPSPSSRPCCARRRPAPSRTCGQPSGRRSPASNPMSVATISPRRAMMPMTRPERQQL